MSRVRIGVVGCGAIAQVQHLPFLTELSEEFEVAAVCDASPSQAAYAARQFRVERQFTDYREMLASDIDAVLLCHSDPKTEAVIASVDAGKHAFVEKPICFSLEEADAIIEASARSGKVVQAGYTKLFEPAYELAKQEVAGIDDVRFVQVNHLHPNNDLHVSQFRTRRFDDLPEAADSAGPRGAGRGAQGGHRDVPPHVLTTFFSLAGSLIHDLYCLRAMFGVPSRVVSTEIWADGRAYSTTLEYPEGHRCVATWVDLPDLWDFHETLEVYGGSKRVIVKFGTGFLQDRLHDHGPGDRRRRQDRPQGARGRLGEPVPQGAPPLPRLDRERHAEPVADRDVQGRRRAGHRHHQGLPVRRPRPPQRPDEQQGRASVGDRDEARQARHPSTPHRRRRSDGAAGRRPRAALPRVRPEQ